MSNSIIEQYFLENNYPSADKRHKLLKRNNHTISQSKIKEGLSKQETEQMMKPAQKKIVVMQLHLKKMNF